MSAPQTDQRLATETKSGGLNKWDVLSRLVVFSLLLAAVGLLWWSYYRVYLPNHKTARTLNASVGLLANEVNELNLRWSKAEIDQVNHKFALVRPRLFTDQPDLESWLADFREQLAPLGLDIATTFASSNVLTQGDSKLLVIPATMSITFQPLTGAGIRASPYERLLQFTHRVTSQAKNADLTGLTVESGSNSVDHAVLGVNFWAGAKEAR